MIGLPMVLIHFEPPRRGQPLYKGQKTIVPKVSFVWRFDWNCTRKQKDLYTLSMYCKLEGRGVGGIEGLNC